MGLPLNFKNILNLFNVSDFNQYYNSSYTIEQNVSIFDQYVEGYYGDGLISLAELRNFSGLAEFPEYIVDNMFAASDTDNDGFLSNLELTNLFSSFDINGSNSLEWSEGLNLFNTFSDVNIPSSTTFTQYSRFLANSQTTFAVSDTDGNSSLDLTEYDAMLQELGIDDGGTTAANMIALFDDNSDGNVSFEEMLVQNIAWDTNQNGIIDYNDGEASEYMDLIPWYLTPQDSMTKIEQIAASLILYNDADQDKELGYDELKNYLVSMAAFPATMVDEMVALYAGGNDSFTYNEIVAMYESFDADSNDELDYEELVSFQNTMLDIDIDSAEVGEKQYAGLYTMGAQYIKAYDGDTDGEISIKEYRAAIKQAEDAYRAQDMEIPENIGQHLAENFVRLFDMDKNGSVSVIEIINQYSLLDLNNDGKISGGENIDLQLRMEDSKLWDNVNEDFISVGDTNYDRELSLAEFQNVLVQKGLPQYIADDAFTMFDLNGNNLLSHLELMEAYSRYDGSAVNYNYYENTTGTSYILYTGNSNQTLDAHERFKLYEDLAAANAGGLNYTPDPAKAAQYEKIYAASKAIIDGYDTYKDGVLTADDYRNYFTDKGLPEYLADAVIAAYDLSGEGNFDLLETIQMNMNYDVNQNGVLDFEEEFKIYDDITGIGLNITEANKLQYKNIYDSVKNFISQYDLNSSSALNQDGSLQIDELEKYFRERGLPDDYSNLALAAFDVNSDGGLDVLEWMKAYADFDADGNGVIGQNEELAMIDSIAGTALPDITDSTRYNTLENTINTLIQNYDISDNDKKLDSTELAAYMRNLGLPDYIADEAITAYDLNGDGGIDKMEWMSAYTNVDHNENGILDFNEEIELYSTLSGATLIPVTEDDIDQYSALYNSLKTFFAQRDNTADRILTAEEMETYFTNLDLPGYMADEVISMYDANSDGGVDIYEWMEPHLLFDINKNGQLDFNELMGLNATLADPDLAIDPNTMNEAQVTNLYNYSKNFIAGLDTEFNDSMISQNELIKYYKTIGLSDNVASSVIASQDTNADGYLDLMEWLNTSLTYDVNSTGVLELNELMNLYQDATGVALNTTDSNLAQHSALYSYAVNTFNSIDTSSNEKLSADEFKTWLTNSYGMTQDMANQIINHYDTTIGNGDGELDALEFTKALLDMDTNTNGRWDYTEQLNLFDEALPALDLGGVNDSNINQYWSMYSQSVGVINNYSGGDKKLSQEELKTWLKESYSLTDDMVNQIISNTDLDGDGTTDALELTSALLDVDANANGKWDYAEQVNFIDDNSSNLLANATDDNIQQFWNLYGYAVGNIKNYGGSDKKMSPAEMLAWLKNHFAMSDDMANQIINTYGGADGMDALEFTSVLLNFDANSNGNWDYAEQMNFFDNALPALDLGNVDDTNVGQYWKLYGFAVNNTNAYGGSDKKMSSEEFRLWLKDSYAITDEMANQIINRYDLDGDGTMDTLEFTDALISVDTNNNGNWDYAEQMNFFDEALPAVDLGGVNETNINQYWSLYSYAVGNVNTQGGGDKKMSPAELRAWLQNSFAITDDMANQMVNSYDLDGDGAMDAMEFTSALLNADTNANGKWDPAEQINFIDDGSGNILGNVNEDNASQYWKLYGYAVGNTKTYGGSDYKMSPAEMLNWLKNHFAMSDDMANQIISHYGGADGMDALEFTRALVNLDVNNNGNWDYAEQMNFFDDAMPAIDLGEVNDANINKYWSLYGTSINTVRAMDIDKDNLISSDEYKAWLKSSGMPAYLADGLIAGFDLNGDNLIDALELTQLNANLDVNNTGGLEFNELMQYYKNLAAAAPNGYTFDFTPDVSNASQLSNAYSSNINFVKGYDTNSDQKLQVGEYEQFLLRSGFANAASMAANAIANFDRNGDGAIDVFEWMDAVLSFDDNDNGILDGNEVANFYNSL